MYQTKKATVEERIKENIYNFTIWYDYLTVIHQCSKKLGHNGIPVTIYK